jgi:crossover junction endodeoxyribonuclease RuvC
MGAGPGGAGEARRILGIDPGSRFTGVGLIEIRGDRVKALHHTVIKTGGGEFTERLGIIFRGVKELAEAHRPHVAAVETVFVSKNPSSAIKLGQARGAAVCALIDCGIPVSEYAPRAIKQALVGRGGADKVQVQHMVKILLSLAEAPREDAADALAVALCHHHTEGTLQRMAALQK